MLLLSRVQGKGLEPGRQSKQYFLIGNYYKLGGKHKPAELLFVKNHAAPRNKISKISAREKTTFYILAISKQLQNIERSFVLTFLTMFLSLL